LAHALIAGWGYLGSYAGSLLARAGHRVTGMRRSRPDVSLPAGISLIQADLLSDRTLPLPDDITWVIYAVGADRFTPEAYRAAYVEGLKRLADALIQKRIPVERFCFVSSTSVYPQQDGEWVDESSPVCGRHFGSATLIEAEQVVSSLPWKNTAARCGGIYGPGRTRLIDAVRSGQARQVRHPKLILNLIHRDDAAGALIHLLNHPSPPPICNLTDLEPIDRNELLCWVAAELGMPAPPWEEETSLSEPARGGNRRVSSRLLQLLGFTHRWPTFREGYRALIQPSHGANAPCTEGTDQE